MPRRNLVAVVVAALLLAGCGSSQHDLVKSKVQQFVRAVGAKDYKTLCTDVLSPELLLDIKEGGLHCEQAMQIALAKVKAPSLALGQIKITGDTASVLTLTGAHGQDAALAAIKLINTPSGWRINSLGSPVPG